MIRLRCSASDWVIFPAAAAAVMLATATASHASRLVLLDENLDAAIDSEPAEILNVVGPTGFSQVENGSVPVNSGLPAVTAFGGFGADAGVQVILDVVTEIGAGPGGPDDDIVTLNSEVIGAPNFTFGGLQAAFTLPTQTLDFAQTLDVSVDVQAPAGTPLSVRVESPFTDTNNGFEFRFTADGTFQTISGNLGDDFSVLGSFDPAATIQLVVATPTGNGALPSGAAAISVNNFLVTAVPEPASAALAALAMWGVCSTRRRR